jgi:cytochrome d ubiquinol oxidase subunit I
MDSILLARLQFAITTVYHFFFVPLTLGLSIFVAVMETMYVRSGQEVYKRMTKFWGKLFVINFAIGVVTGIVQEFQFGMNWSDFSRFVGDIFGAPLAIEALLAFFLESTFLGIWLFGWNKLPKKIHLLAIWLVALGSNISALWILIANSWMQHPVGYTIVDGQAQLTSFASVVFNRHVFYQFPHVIFAGMVTGSFFVVGISAYHLFRKNEVDLFRRSLKMAAMTGVIFTVLVAFVGHLHGQYLIEIQPMKMSAAEALWESEDPASFNVIAISDVQNRRNIFAIQIPRVLSLLSYNRLSGEVQGINNLLAEDEVKYGPGDYIPPVMFLFWAFRSMVGIAILLIILGLFALFLLRPGKMERFPWALKVLTWALLLPYLANISGWLFTELGRFPWVVYGIMKIEKGVSPRVTPGMLSISLIGYILVYGSLILVTVYLLMKFAKAGPSAMDDSLLAGEHPADSLPSIVS